MNDSFTITALITLLESGLSRFHDANVKWDASRSSFTATLGCSGYSVDKKNGDEWEEVEMRYLNCYPFMEEDEIDYENDYGNDAFRTHDYKRCYIDICVTLPNNRHRGDTYTAEEVMKMVECVSFGDDIPGMGFTYYNCESD